MPHPILSSSAGLTTNEIAVLTAFAPLDKWALAWDELLQEWVTTVICPHCHQRHSYEVRLLPEFDCGACGYILHDAPEPRLLPRPVPLSP